MQGGKIDKMNGKVRARIYGILETAAPGDLPSKIFDLFIVGLIFLNIIAVILETVESLSSKYLSLFNAFELFSVGIFTAEYVMRLWTSTSNPKFKHSITGRIRFAVTPLILIDLLAILPFYLPMIIPFDLRFMRALRLFRLFRLFKIGRYSESVRTLGDVFKAKKEELFLAIFGVLILLIVASSLMYYVEGGIQPHAFSNIPAAMWWSVATLTTVGYGDVYPIYCSG